MDRQASNITLRSGFLYLPASADRLLPVLRGGASDAEIDAFCAESLAAAPDETFSFRLDESFLQLLATSPKEKGHQTAFGCMILLKRAS